MSNPQLAGNREKIKTWIRDQATLFLSTYFSPAASEAGEAGNGQSGEGSGGPTSGLSVLSELTRLVQRLETEPLLAKETLEQIRAIVADSDVSSFEILHSGLVQSLLKYLTADGIDRTDRLRLFLQVRKSFFFFIAFIFFSWFSFN
jgi:E3 ubiquitin-protein ligase TRIP12